MKYSISTLKIALGISITENTKLTKEQKIKMLEFVQKGTDIEIQHLALTGEVKRLFTESEKKHISEKCKNVKITQEIKNMIRENPEGSAIDFLAKTALGVGAAGATAVSGGAALAARRIMKNRKAKKICKAKYPNDQIEYAKCYKAVK